MSTSQSREAYIKAVRRYAIGYAVKAGRLSLADARRAMQARIMYGVGSARGARGVCYHGAWQNGGPETVAVIEICAAGEESALQLAGTTLHEIGHALGDFGDGHGPLWKARVQTLGLLRVHAAGQVYDTADFDPALMARLQHIPRPDDGAPLFGAMARLGGALRPGALRPTAPRPCSAGQGARGGRSRGAGSGSRLRRFLCECPDARPVYAARDELNATCNVCIGAFKRAEAPQAAQGPEPSVQPNGPEVNPT